MPIDHPFFAYDFFRKNGIKLFLLGVVEPSVWIQWHYYSKQNSSCGPHSFLVIVWTQHSYIHMHIYRELHIYAIFDKRFNYTLRWVTHLTIPQSLFFTTNLKAYPPINLASLIPCSSACYTPSPIYPFQHIYTHPFSFFHYFLLVFL